MLELQLDIRTLSFVTVLFAALFGMGLLVVASQHQDQPGLTRFGQSILVLGLGFLLLGFRGKVPDALSIVLANWLIVAAFVLFHNAAAIFRKSPFKGFYVGPTILVLLPALFIYYTYGAPSVSLRITFVSLFISFLSGLCALVIVRGTKKDHNEAVWLTATPFLITCGFFLFRSLWAMDETTMRDFMSASTIHQLAFLVINVLVLTSSFGLLWILSSRLQQELRKQARVDTLTRAYNRRALSEIGTREMARSDRHGLPLASIMIDIDHFKEINDAHGHRAGDIVLAIFADTIREVIRKQDYLIRHGGEEFLVLLPDTKAPQAEQVAEKLRTMLQGEPLCTEPPITVTASFGVTARHGQEPWEIMIARADAALYEAKQAGRNRVVRR